MVQLSRYNFFTWQHDEVCRTVLDHDNNYTTREMVVDCSVDVIVLGIWFRNSFSKLVHTTSRLSPVTSACSSLSSFSASPSPSSPSSSSSDHSRGASLVVAADSNGIRAGRGHRRCRAAPVNRYAAIATAIGGAVIVAATTAAVAR